MKNENEVLDSPVWIILINVVALEMLKAKMPRFPGQCLHRHRVLQTVVWIQYNLKVPKSEIFDHVDSSVFFTIPVSLGTGDFGADMKESKSYRLDLIFPVLLAKKLCSSVHKSTLTMIF